MKTCWSCGHYLIGGGCWKDGHMGEEGWKDVSPDDCCSEWVPEKSPKTINAKIENEF
jgi:hypothetical protein